jgi:hypothetical protein
MPSIYDIKTENESFIGAWIFDDTSICDDILEFWSTGNKTPGQINSVHAGGCTIDKTIKDSLDLVLDNNTELYDRYTTHLQSVIEKYIEKYQWCDKYAAWTILENINIQGYPPGGGYLDWHTERMDALFPGNNRHLVFMTYLNNVFDAGETEFYYQKLKVQPRKGLTLIWPADWTHTHRGIKSETEEKCIVTGWFSFYRNVN